MHSYNDPLFQSVRKLPLEVSLEQVQGFLATPGTPRGSSHSWFNTLKLFTMIGLILTTAAVLLWPAEELQQEKHGSTTEAPPPVELWMAGLIPIDLDSSKLQFAKVIQEDTHENPPKKQQAPIVLNSERLENDNRERAENTQEERRPQKADEAQQSENAIVQEVSFLITHKMNEKEIAMIVSQGRETNMRIWRKKVKSRLGRLKHIKLQFAVPGEQSKLTTCAWKDFRDVSLKGFSTYEYGWSVKADGTIFDFWDKVDTHEADTLSNPATACSSLRVNK